MTVRINLVLLIILATQNTLWATTLADAPKGCIEWKLPVALSEKASERVRSAAIRLAKSLGQEAVASVRVNPVCTLWVETDHWKPNPGDEGYIILVQAGGAIIRASSDEQVERAVAELEKHIIVQGGVHFLPTGLITSYLVIPERVKKD